MNRLHRMASHTSEDCTDQSHPHLLDTLRDIQLLTASRSFQSIRWLDNQPHTHSIITSNGVISSMIRTEMQLRSIKSIPIHSTILHSTLLHSLQHPLNPVSMHFYPNHITPLSTHRYPDTAVLSKANQFHTTNQRFTLPLPTLHSPIQSLLQTIPSNPSTTSMIRTKTAESSHSLHIYQ